MTGELSHAGRALAALGQQVARLRAECDRKADQVEAMAKVLRDLEWDADAECPWCHESEDDGHAVDCALDAALRMGER